MSAALVSRRSREDQHPKRRVLCHSLGVVGVLVAREAAVGRLTEQIGQRELEVAPRTEIREVSLDQRAQAEPLVRLARQPQQQPGVGGHRRAMELDAELGVQREANRASFRVTHWVAPPVPARSP